MRNYVGKKFKCRDTGSIYVAAEFASSEQLIKEFHQDRNCSCDFTDDDGDDIDPDDIECQDDHEPELALELVDKSLSDPDWQWINDEEQLFARFQIINKITMISKKRIKRGQK